MSENWIKLLLVFAIGLGIVTVSFAQPKLNSPYSRIGLGELADHNFSALRAMGGISAAYHDPYQLNTVNPASYTYLKATSFAVGLDARYGRLESQGVNTGIWSGNLSYFAFGFPMKNPINREVDREKSPVFWSMNFALLPYSNVGYNITTEEAFSDIDTILFNFQGSGGTMQFLWGNAVRYKNFSLGLNLGYMFGKISNDRIIVFRDLADSYENDLNDEFSIRGIVWRLGAQYDIVFESPDEQGISEPNGKRLTFGIYGNSKNTLSTNSSRLWGRRNLSYTFALDTITAYSDSLMNATLPAEFGIGVMYSKDNKWKIGADFKISKWSGYRNEAKPENPSLADAWRFSVGGEIVPDYRSYKGFFKKIRYRFGAFYAKDPRITSTSLINYGVTTGMGLPIDIKNQTISFIDLGFEFGRLGSSDDSTLRDLYGKVTLGFTLNDNQWFLKRKFY